MDMDQAIRQSRPPKEDRKLLLKRLERQYGPTLDAMTDKEKLEVIRHAQKRRLNIMRGLGHKARHVGWLNIGRNPFLSILAQLDE